MTINFPQTIIKKIDDPISEGIFRLASITNYKDFYHALYPGILIVKDEENNDTFHLLQAIGIIEKDKTDSPTVTTNDLQIEGLMIFIGSLTGNYTIIKLKATRLAEEFSTKNK